MKVVAIGTIGHINYLFDGLRRNPDLRLVGIATASSEDSPETAAIRAKEFGCQVFSDWRAMLDETKPDVAGVSTRFDLNGPVTIECLDRGVHAFTEKCIALEHSVLAGIESRIRSGRARVVGMHAMRYSPEIYAVWKAAKEGRIGKPRLFSAQKSYHFGTSRPDFYRDRSLYGGTIPWVGSHAVDWALWTMGPVRSLWASHDGEDNFGYGDCEAHAAVAFSFQGGGEGVLTADFYRTPRAKGHGDDRLRLAGPGGVLEARGGKATILDREGEERELPLEPAGDFFGDWCRELRGLGTCRLSTEETIEVTRLCLRARDAADANRGGGTEGAEDRRGPPPSGRLPD